MPVRPVLDRCDTDRARTERGSTGCAYYTTVALRGRYLVARSATRAARARAAPKRVAAGWAGGVGPVAVSGRPRSPGQGRPDPEPQDSPATVTAHTAAPERPPRSSWPTSCRASTRPWRGRRSSTSTRRSTRPAGSDRQAHPAVMAAPDGHRLSRELSKPLTDEYVKAADVVPPWAAEMLPRSTGRG